MRYFRAFSALVSLIVLLSLVPAATAARALAATPHRPGSRHPAAAASHARVRMHPTRLVPAAHPSRRLIRVRQVRIVRARGRVVRSRVVPWPRGHAASARTTVSGQPGTQRAGAVRLTAFMTSGDGDVEYPTPTQNSEPAGVAVTPDDAAWFTEVSANKVGRVTESGLFTEYPLPLTQPSPVIASGWITVGADGNLWLAGEENNVARIAPGGSVTPFPLYGPSYSAIVEGITLGPDGNVWFTTVGASGSSVGYVTPGGAVTEYQVASNIQVLEGITAGPDGAMWFVNGSQETIDRITTGGALTEFQMPSGSALEEITTGPDRRLWFGDAGAIGAMTTSGSYTLYQVPSNEVYESDSIAVDRSAGTQGLVFVAEGAIGLVTTSGLMSFAPTVGQNLGSGTQIGWAPDGTVWYPDVDANAMGMLPPGPAQFPPGVPAAETYGVRAGRRWRRSRKISGVIR